MLSDRLVLVSFLTVFSVSNKRTQKNLSRSFKGLGFCGGLFNTGSVDSIPVQFVTTEMFYHSIVSDKMRFVVSVFGSFSRTSHYSIGSFPHRCTTLSGGFSSQVHCFLSLSRCFSPVLHQFTSVCIC